MDEKLIELFERFKHFRVMQEIVNEIVTIDYYVYNFDEEKAIDLIDFFIRKYNREMKQLASYHRDKTIIENDPHVYETKTEEDVNDDAKYVRNCLIMIGAVKSGIRQTLKQVYDEVKN